MTHMMFSRYYVYHAPSLLLANIFLIGNQQKEQLRLMGMSLACVQYLVINQSVGLNNSNRSALEERITDRARLSGRISTQCQIRLGFDPEPCTTFQE